MTTTSRQVRGLIGNVADMLTHEKDGTWTARRSFFYTGGKTAQDFAARILDCLGSDAEVLESGTVRKAFRGNAGVKAGSHWWVKFTIKSACPAPVAEPSAAEEYDAHDAAIGDFGPSDLPRTKQYNPLLEMRRTHGIG